MTVAAEKGTNDLHGRTAIVTGGAGNLGRAISLALRDRGCRVVVLDREASLKDSDSESMISRINCDLTDPEQVGTCIRDVWERFGPASILVNAVGSIYSAPLINIASTSERRHSYEAWTKVIDANLNSVFLTTVNIVDRMVATRTRGVVVNMSSIASAGNAGQGAYSAAKAAVNAMTIAWAKELGPMGIRFVAIAPGFIDTATTQAAMSEPTIKDWIRRTPLRRLGAVEDITAAVLFAITNGHLTGKIIEIDGGLTL